MACETCYPVCGAWTTGSVKPTSSTAWSFVLEGCVWWQLASMPSPALTGPRH